MKKFKYLIWLMLLLTVSPVYSQPVLVDDTWKDVKFITQVADSNLNNEQALGTLATGLVKNTTTTGVLSIAVAGTDYLGSVTADTPLSGSGTSGSHLVIANAAADGSTKGAVTFNATNFSCSSGVCNTVQDIATSSLPFFSGIKLLAPGSIDYNSTSSSASAYPAFTIINQASSSNSFGTLFVKGNAGSVGGYFMANGLGTGVIAEAGIQIGSLTNHPLILTAFQAEVARVDGTGMKLTGLTASRPVITTAGKYLSSGSYSGNTTTLATSTGSLTSGDGVKLDASGNYIDSGAAYVDISNAAKITNKVNVPRTQTAADATSISVNSDTYVWSEQTNTQGAGTLTINNPTGTPTAGQPLAYAVKCSSAQTLSWGANFVASTGTPLPSSQLGDGKEYQYFFKYSGILSKWVYAGSNGGYS